MSAGSLAGAVLGGGSRWINERRRLYREWERIREVEAQARTLVNELRTRRDGFPSHTYDLWAIREALVEVDHGPNPEED